MKIAVLTSSYPRFEGDGTAPFIKSISETLAKLGNDVEVVAPYDPAVKIGEQGVIPVHRFRYVWSDRWSFMGHARALEADVRLRPLSYLLLPLFLFSAFFKLMAVTKKQQSQAVHVHWVIPNGPVAATVARLRKIPLIVSLHGSDIYLAKKNRLFGQVARWVFQSAAAVTVCSEELRQSAISLGAPQDTLLLPWGADPDIFTPDWNDPAYRADWNLGQSAIIVLALGRMVHKKGFNILLEAMPDLIAQDPRIHLVLAGDGPLLQTLEQRAIELGISKNITFPGRIPWNQTPDLLAAANIFVLPSIKDEYGNLDGLPTVLLEAMASETAVVASDIGGVKLVINPDQNGLLIEPGDSSALKDAILSLSHDPDKRQKLAKAARQAVVDHYNWVWVSRQFIRLLENAVWKRQHKLRLGTAYRDEMVRILDKRPTSGRVLDIGCHDGYWLSTLESGQKIGVDPEPTDVHPHTNIVQADGTKLPFAEKSFDWVFAMDVIEHVENDAAFASSISSMVAPGGQLFLSTPSINIRLTPPFLTRWISRQWGHHLRLGYTIVRLQELFGDTLAIRIYPWNAPVYRFYYLPIRLFSNLAPRLSNRIVQQIARIDAQNTPGLHGFLILEGTRPAPAHDPVKTAEN